MKKMLIIANTDLSLYRFRKELIEEIMNREYEVYISSPMGQYIEDFKKMGCKYIETPLDRRGMNPIKDIGLALRYRKILREVKPEFVITYAIKPNVYGGFMCRTMNIPYIVNITGLGSAFQSESIMKKLIVFMYRQGLKKAKSVFVENEGNKKTVVDCKITSNENCIVMNGAGVNVEEYEYKPMTFDGKTRFLFMGRLMKEKGIEELLYAAKKIKEVYKDVEFDLIGFFEENYREVVEDLDSKKIINYHGFQRDVKTFIESAHCIVLPSYHEGMSNTLLESGAIGRALITSNIHGCKEAVDEGKTGFLCNVKDKDSLFEALNKFYTLSNEEKQLMGEKSRKHIQSKFNRSIVINESLNCIFNNSNLD